MMKIDFFLDQTNKLNPDEVLGDIVIESNDGIIEEKDAYIDSWFVGLITGFEQVFKEGYVEIDLIEESYPLILQVIESKIKIVYKGSEASTSIVDLKSSLTVATKRLLGMLRGSSGYEENQLIKQIELFVQNKN